MPDKIYKAIRYAYPYSANAKKLNCIDTGCWYVETDFYESGPAGLSLAKITIASAGFGAFEDPDLMAAFNAAPGEASWSFRRYAPPDILAALGLERAGSPTADTIRSRVNDDDKSKISR